MFKNGEYVVYKNEVCIIKEIKENFFKGNDYYVLSSSSDVSLTINVPIGSQLIKPIISSQEAHSLINSIPSIKPINTNDKMLENEYRNLLRSEKKTDLIKIIKTTYLRNEERLKLGKKISEKDEIYFNKAEKLLYSELAISLGMSYDQVKQYIINIATNLANSNK